MLTASLLLAATSPAAAQATYTPPRHESDQWPGLVEGGNQAQVAASFAKGPELERDRPATWLLADHRRLDATLAALPAAVAGRVNAYVVTIGLDSDMIFGREAREAAKVLARRYDAAARTVVLAGSDGGAPSALPSGSPRNLYITLARIAELMDRQRDVLVLYTTGHGAPIGLAYHDADSGFGIVSPERLARVLDELGIRNRLLILSACYSGIFVGRLSNDTTALLTATSPERVSFGCQPDGNWTYFGDALINNALRKPIPLADAGREARELIRGWETAGNLTPSQPQVAIGRKVVTWLQPLEARLPLAAAGPTGAVAVASTTQSGR